MMLYSDDDSAAIVLESSSFEMSPIKYHKTSEKQDNHCLRNFEGPLVCKRVHRFCPPPKKRWNTRMTVPSLLPLEVKFGILVP